MSTLAKVIIGILIAIAIIACIAVVIILVTGPSEPDPTAVPPTTAPETPPEAGDDSWDKIEAAGKIVVGTSADYPPFEFYVDDMKIDGFDVAMMDEMGRRLGVTIEYLDYAFDGLGPALQLGQIDLALAAVSVTAERESVVDFSNIYLVGEDAVLAKKGSGITISSVDDMAGYRIGVQRNTVYEAWILTELVAKGKMPESNLFVYELATHAFRDLNEGRIDLAVFDAQPAELAVQEYDVEIVGQGLNQQRYAIAFPKGAAALKEKIDGVLLELHNEGVIAALASKYLGQEVLLPTPTPGPTSTPKPPSECLDGMSFIAHPDGAGSSDNPIQVAPGAKFTKVWTVQNTGTCTWDSSYSLVFASGDRMGGQPTSIQGTVAPGQNYDIAVNMTAPLYSGSYQGIWQMVNGQGTAFGQRIRVYVQVMSGPTATPAPTQTPVAGIVFTVDRDQINYGECVNFYWKVENVKEIYFYHEGEDWRDNGVTGEETRTECPPATLNYYLRVVLRDGSVSTSKITIYVTSQPDAPYIQRFTADPPNLVTLGGSVMLQWEVFNQVNKLTLSANDVVLWEGAPTKGSYQDTPTSTGSVSYLLVAEGDGGTSQSRINLTVVDSSTATPVPTSAPDQPVIYSFSVSPNSIAEGDCVDINWSAGGGASHVEVLRDGSVIVPDAPFSGHANDCPTPAGAYEYQLAASNSAGETVTQQRTVQVSATAPDNPLANTMWTLSNYWDGTQMQAVLPGTLLTTNFGASSGVSGSGGCNTYSATYQVSGSSLTISAPLATGKLCDTDISDQEQAFFAAMESATGYNIEAGQLYILGSSGTTVLEYVATGP